ncbi:MAG: S-layer homology domain-containing protein [Ruminococcaceae bacterium]|nr:S-layer homology domain-containing protein [Oscillospiraceae bacterium]
MNKGFSKALSAILFCSLVMSTVVAYGYSLKYDGGENDFVVSGAVEQKTAGQLVTVKVEKDNNLIFARQTETQSNGEYFLTFNIEQLGDATLTVSENGDTFSKPIYKSTPDEVASALGRLNGSESEASVILDGNNSKILQIDASSFASKNADGIITDYLMGKTFANLSEFTSAYSKAEFLADIKTAGSGEEVLNAANGTDFLSMLQNVNAKETYISYDDSKKTLVLSKLAGNKYTSDQALSDALMEFVIFNEINNTSLINEKWDIIQENNDFLEIGLSKYTALQNQFASFTLKLFEGNSFDTVSELKLAMEQSYDFVTKDDGGGSFSGGGIKNVTVSSDLAKTEVPNQSIGFDDLEGYDWAYNAILSLAIDGVINGKSHRVFAPGDDVTRAEFTKIIIDAFGLYSDSATAAFSDVEESHWAYRHIASAAKERIVMGTSDTTFNPAGKITRQDMAVICYRILNSLGVKLSTDGTSAFADERSIADYAKTAVQALSANGVINGKGASAFEPTAYATRAEAAKIIYTLAKIN